jgi:hypothetical protein
MIRKPGRPYGVRIGPGVDPLVVWLGMYLAGEELSSEIIAEKAGLSGCCVRQWVNGRRAPGLMDVRAVVSVLGYDLVLRRRSRKHVHAPKRSAPEPRSDKRRIKRKP